MTIVNVTLHIPPAPRAFELYNVVTGHPVLPKFFTEYHANEAAAYLMEEMPGSTFAVRPLAADPPFTLLFDKVGP